MTDLIQRLRAAAYSAAIDIRDAHNYLAEAADALEAQQAEIARLRAALTPFAAIDMASTDLPQDFAWDVLRARAALEKS